MKNQFFNKKIIPLMICLVTTAHSAEKRSYEEGQGDTGHVSKKRRTDDSPDLSNASSLDISPTPPEIFSTIFEFGKDFKTYSLVCKKWQSISDQLWVQEIRFFCFGSYDYASRNARKATILSTEFEGLLRRFSETVKELDLSSVRLQSLYSYSEQQISVESLTHLESLCLKQRHVLSSNSFRTLTNLTQLDLSHSNTHLGYIRDCDLSIMTNLTKLNIRNNYTIKDSGIRTLTNLQSLSIGGSLIACGGRVDISDDGLSKLTNLTCLKITPNASITKGGILKLPKLKSLKICKFIDSSVLGQMTYLTHLDPSGIRLLDQDLEKLTNLRSLSLCRYRDNIDVNDSGLRYLTNLTVLDLSENSAITNNGLMALSNLKKLKLCSNYAITDQALTCLMYLTELDLARGSNITDAGLIRLSNLKKLNLSSNIQITSLSLKKLTGLTWLNITCNDNMTNEGICDLVNLEILYLGWNKHITTQGIEKLTKLKYLDFQGIRIPSRYAVSRMEQEKSKRL